MRPALLIVLALCLATHAIAADKWGAVAFSARTRNAGTAHDWPAKKAAGDEALKQCAATGAKDCVLAVAYRGESCASIAVVDLDKRPLRWGAAVAAKLMEAQDASLVVCSKKTHRKCGYPILDICGSEKLPSWHITND